MNRDCPLCGKQQATVIFHPINSPGPVSKCLNCGMVYIERIENELTLIFDGPMTYGGLDSSINTSSDINDAKGLWSYQDILKREAEWPVVRKNGIDSLQKIESFIDQPAVSKKILDFGSGWGFFLATAKERGWLTYGLEPLPECAIYARAKFQLDILTDTLHSDSFAPDFFNVITSFQVFEHLPDPRKDIDILYSVLRPDGIILIEVPNIETWTVHLMKSKHRHFVQDHINFFSRNTLKQFLANHGFKILDSYFPKRRMSIRHLFTYWFPKYLPGTVVNRTKNILQSTKFYETTVGINLGDIITVIAKKV